MDDGLAKLELEPLTEVEREFGENSQSEESRRTPDRAAIVTPGDGPVDDRGDRPRHGRLLDCPGHGEGENRVPFGRVGPSVGENAAQDSPVQRRWFGGGSGEAFARWDASGGEQAHTAASTSWDAAMSSARLSSSTIWSRAARR